MNRNHQSRNTMKHTAHGREHAARHQLGPGMHNPTRFNPKEFQRFIETPDYNPQDNLLETAYQDWISDTQDYPDYTGVGPDYSAYRSDGPGPVEIEARQRLRHDHDFNTARDYHNKMFSYRAQAEMDEVNDETYIRSFRGVGPKGYRRSDESINEEIHRMLADEVYIDASGISVQVKDAVATLVGSVRSRQYKFKIEDVVEKVPGVESVENKIRVLR